jgi:hypothetical protein
MDFLWLSLEKVLEVLIHPLLGVTCFLQLRFHLGDCGLLNKSGPFHTSEDNKQWSNAS